VSEIRAERVIEASAEEVFGVLADLPAYAEWNPFTPGVRSTLVVGSPVELDVVLHGRLYHQVETVLANDPGRELAWGARMGGGLLLRTRRSQIVTPIDARRSRYASHQRIEGLLAPLVKLLYARTIRDGFEAVGDALARRFDRSG
jgi:hypothetical protein